MNRIFIVVCALVAVAAAGSLDWRIVGGEKAEDGQFPYIISLRQNGRHNCGGTILNNRWVLTAAHCVEGANPKSLTVVAGSNKLDQGGVTYQVEKVMWHPDWDRSELVNDVGLVRVTSDIDLGPTIQNLDLNEEEIGGDADVTLCGWGTTSYPGSIPNDLQFIKLKSLSFEDCKSKHSNRIFESEICTLTKKGEGACHGDSGGPLVYKGKVCGIVSWGRPCAQGYPDVFTRVSSFVAWIKENTAN